MSYLSGCSQDCWEALQAGADRLAGEGINLEIREELSGLVTILGCSFAGKPPRHWHRKVAVILADIIVNNMEEKILAKLLERGYSYLKAGEKRQIKERILHLQRCKNGVSEKTLRRESITERLEKNLQEQKTLALEGFINFRLQDYQKELRALVDRAVEEYLMEKEYKEFVRLLRYFVDVQEPKTTSIDVYCSVSGYKIIDDCSGGASRKGKDVPYDEDLLLSTLITIAPEEIIIHVQGVEPPTLLEGVFGDRLINCPGCEFCR